MNVGRVEVRRINSQPHVHAGFNLDAAGIGYVVIAAGAEIVANDPGQQPAQQTCRCGQPGCCGKYDVGEGHVKIIVDAA